MKTCYLKAAISCTFALMLAACNKEGATPSSQNIVSMQDDPIEQLRTFRRQIEAVKADPDQRSQETIPLSEALWDVENHFNMTYSDPEQYYEETNKHQITLALPVSDEQVLVYDAVNLYEQVTEEARQALSSDTFESKGVISLHLDHAEEVDGNLMLTYEAKTGERSTYSPPINILGGPFGIDDDWIDTAPMGKCDDPDIPSGADEQLQEKLFDKLIGDIPEAEPGKRNIFLDRKTFVFDGYDYDNLYITDVCYSCISHEEMNSYYNHEKYIIDSIIPEQYHLIGYQPISIIIKTHKNLTYGTFSHLTEVEYGKLYRISTDEFGEVESLLP